MIRERNIVTNIILTFLTCGLYGVYWFITLTDDAATVDDDNSMSGGLSLLLVIVTCGLYSFYWLYKMDKAICSAKTKRGQFAKENFIVYLLLQLIGLGIVNYCIMQDELNKIAATSPMNTNTNPENNQPQA